MIKPSFMFYSWKIKILALSFLLMAGSLSGQDESIRHLVKSKETFYSISKQYDVTIDQIKTANPGVEYPKAGDYLVIPRVGRSQDIRPSEWILYQTAEEVSIYMLARLIHFPIDSIRHWNPNLRSLIPASTKIKTRPADPEITTIVHNVMDERSTLKDLALIYGTDYSALRELNPQIKRRVWYGQQVKVPVIRNEAFIGNMVSSVGVIPGDPEEPTTEPINRTHCRKEGRNKERIYRVALMVPFSLQETTNIDTLMRGTPSEMMDLPSFRFIQFYQGFLLAADSLSKNGLKLELSVFDVDQNVSKANSLIRRPELKEMDLLIGPFYKNTFPVLANFALNHGIPIVNPLSNREDVLIGNPNVFKVIPSQYSQAPGLASLVNHRFKEHHIFIVRENKYQGSNTIENIRTHLSGITGKEIPVVDYMIDSIPGVRKQILPHASNLIIVYSESEVLPVELLPVLNEISKRVDISLVGLPEWERFEQLENNYLIRLGTYLFSDSYIDYREPRVKKFITMFRSRYRAEPLEYAYSGFDLGWFFLSSLMDYGRNFSDCCEQIDYPLLQTRFNFYRIPEGGYDNTYWNIYYFKDHSLIQVPQLKNYK